MTNAAPPTPAPTPIPMAVLLLLDFELSAGFVAGTEAKVGLIDWIRVVEPEAVEGEAENEVDDDAAERDPKAEVLELPLEGAIRNWPDTNPP